MTCEEIIRILLVDDIELVRRTLRTILSAHPRLTIVGEACDGEEALAWVQRCDPSVVVMMENVTSSAFARSPLTISVAEGLD